nr:hypothetical protein BaRGS_034897 [Batillaria attramentaria]
MADAREVKEAPLRIFRTFYSTCLHLEGSAKVVSFPKTAFALGHVTCSLDEDETRWILRKNIAKGHGNLHALLLVLAKLSETYLERRLTRSSGGKPDLEITIYANWSPCASKPNKDAEHIMHFVKEAEKKYDVSLEIVFAGLYNIMRPSCYYSPGEQNCRPCQHGPLSSLKPHTHKENADGLRLLHRHGVNVRTFKPGDWHVLTDYLVLERGAKKADIQEVVRQDGELRRVEDRYMADDLEYILHVEQPLKC